jgi:Chaperone of endosialidase
MFRTFIFDSNNKLLVKGDITIDDGTSNYIVLQSDSSDLNTLRVNGNTKVTSNVYALNKLGVGTSNPTERVDVIDNLKTSSNLYVMNWIGAGTSNPTERIDIVGNGKVRSNLFVLSNLSISHSNPTENLDINGNAKISSNVYVLSKIGINTSNPTVGLEVNTTDAVLIAKGTTSQRPNTPILGHVRYNTDNSQFEGFGAGSAWGSLGGVKSTNQQTYVSAEEYPTSNDDNIRFYNSNIESMRITRERLVGINTTTPSERVDIVGNTKVSSNVYVLSKIGINTSNPAVGLEVNTTDAVLLSKGTTSQRPSVPVLGHVRYNVDNSQFEGFGAGSAWGSLGGVKSTNQQTYVSAEEYPTSNDDNIRFYNSNIESMRITRERLVGINTTTPSERVDIVGNTKISSNVYVLSKIGINTSNPAVGLEVNTTDAVLLSKGTTAERPSDPMLGHVRYNTDNSQFEGFGAGSVWGSLGGVKSTDQQTYISAEEYPTSNDGIIRFYNSNIETMRIIREGNVGIGVPNSFNSLLRDYKLDVSGMYRFSDHKVDNVWKSIRMWSDDISTSFDQEFAVESNGESYLSFMGFDTMPNPSFHFNNFSPIPMYFATNNTSRLYISETGDVGIGIEDVQTPTIRPSEKFEVVGNIKISSNAYVLSSLGVNTSNPSEIADIVGNLKVSSNIYASNAIVIGGDSNPTENLDLVGNAKMSSNLYVLSNIAIAHSNPTEKLDIIGNIKVSSNIYASNAIVIGGRSNPTENLDLVGNAKMSSNLYVLSNIAIAHSNPTEKLDIIGNIKVSSNIYASNAIVIGGRSNPTEKLDLLGNAKMSSNLYVLSNIAIAHSNPTEKLDIIGNLKVSSNIYASNAIVIGGSSNPTEKLDLVGNAKMSSNLYVLSRLSINSSNPSVGLEVNTTDAVLIAKGTTAQRPSVPVLGHVRYNVDNSQFEGFGAGSAWGSLGGVKSTNQQTYVSAEEYPTSNDDNIRFYNSNIESMRITRQRLVGINTTTPSERVDIVGNVKVSSNEYVLGDVGIGTSNPSYKLDVVGEARIQSNLYIGMDNSTVSGTYTSGKILFGGTSGDTGYANAQIAVRKYLSDVEASEMVIAKFKDPSNTLGPDRVRIRAGAIAFDVYSNASDYNNLDDDFTTSNIRMYIMSNGNVGIGTTEPTSQLEVIGDAKTTSVTTSNISTSNLTSSNIGTCNLIVNTIVASNIITSNLIIVNSNISTDNITADQTIVSSNIFTSNLYSSSKIGIGTQNPLHQLEVNGDAYVSGSTILSNSLNVSGPMTLCNTINLSGAALLSNTLITYGTTTLSNTLTISGATTLSNTLNVSGATLLSNSLTTYNGPSTFSNNVIVSGQTSLSNTLNVAGAVSLSNTLNVAGSSFMSNDLTIIGKSTLCNVANLYGATTLSNTFTVSGATTLSNTLTTYNGTTTHSNAVTVSGITTLSNNLNVSGPMTLCNSLNVSGVALLSNTLTTYGATTLSNTLTVSGGITLSNTLNVSGATLLSNALTTYNGTTTHSNAVIVSGNTTLSNSLNVSGPMTLCNSINVSGAALLSNTLTTYGASTLSNTVTISGATTLSNSLNVSGATLLSNAVTTYNGTTTHSNAVIVSGITTLSNNLNVSGLMTLCNSMNVSGATVLSNTLTTYGITTLSNTLGVVGATTLSNTLLTYGVTSLSNNLNVSGSTYLSNTLNVSGATTLSNILLTYGVTTLSNSVIVAGITLLSNALTTYNGTTTHSNAVIVSGITTLSNNLNVSGPMTLCNSMNVSGAALLSNTLITYGATTLSNTLTISGATTLSNTINVSGATTLSNGITVYNGTSTLSNNTYISGNVGIGTSSTNAKLDVRGAIYIDGATGQYPTASYASKKEFIRFGSIEGTSDYARIYGEGATDAGKLVIAISDNMDSDEAVIFRGEKFDGSTRDNMTIRNDGLVGIGTGNTMTEKLQVSSGKIYSDTQLLGTSNDSVSVPSFSFKEDSNTGIFHASNDAIGFTTNSSEKMRIDTYGNIGIGTTTPTEKVEIVGTTKITSNLYVMSKLGVGTSNISTACNFLLHVAGDARIDGNLDVTGIFSVTNTDVKITDQFTISNNGTGPGLKVYQMGANHIADFYDDTTLALRVADGGSVGIKTGTPTEVLDVVGNTKISSNAYVMSQLGVGTSNIFYTLDVAGTQRTTGATMLSNTVLVYGASTFSNSTTTTGIASVSNNFNVSGVSTLLGGSKIVVQGGIDGGSNVGIFTWSAADTNWGIYTGQSGAGKSLGGKSAVAGAGVNSHATRVRVNDNAFQGIIFENSSEKLLMSVRGSDGYTFFSSNVGVGTSNWTEKLQVAGKIHSDTQVLGTSNDTVSTPSFSFKEDSNTGIYHPIGASTIAVVTGGTERLRVDSSGNVGIASTNATEKLQVAGKIYSETQVLSTSNDSVTTPAFSFKENSNTGIFHAAVDTLGISTGGTERVRVDNVGNVGIGVSPTSTLDVNGRLNLRAGNSANSYTSNQITFSWNNGTYHQHAIKSRHNSSADNTQNAIDFYLWQTSQLQGDAGNKQVLSITSPGVGIFNSNPAYSLDVTGTINSTGNITGPTITSLSNLGMFNSNTAVSASNTTIALSNYTYGTNTTNITNAQTTANWASNAGLFGSNTAVWSSNNLLNKAGGVISGSLQVNGNITVDAKLSFSNNTSVNTPQVGVSGGTGDKVLLWPGTGPTYPYSLGIADRTLWYSVPTPSMHQWYVGGSVGMTLSNNLFGIGTTNPQHKLDVNGTSRFSSTMNLSSNIIVSGGVANSADASIGNMLIKTYNKSLGTTALNYTNICILTISNSASLIFLDVVHSEADSSEAKSYIIPINWLGSTASYYALLPISSTGAYAGNDWNVEMNPNGNVSTLRLVRVSGSTSSVNFTCTLRIIQSSTSTVAIADSTTTGTGATNIGIYESTQLTQVDGNVGVGMSNPSSKLDVSGAINSTGIITGPTITFLSNLGMFGSNTAVSASNTTFALSNYTYGTNTTNITDAQTTANWASNAGLFGSNTAVSASNTTIALSNYTYGTNTTNITNAQTTANWASNAGLFGSNTAVSASNKTIALSNYTYGTNTTNITNAQTTANWASNAGLFGSNTAVSASNKTIALSNYTYGTITTNISWASNAGLFGSNTAVSASNTTFALSNYTYGTNTTNITNAQTTANWSSNAGLFGSNTAISASNTTFALSNYTYGTNTTNITNAQTTANWASNAGLFGSNTAVSASNKTISLSNYTYGTNTTNITNAQTTANWASNAGLFGSNTAISTSNTTFALSNYTYGTNTTNITNAQTTASWSSNAGLFGSNTAISASNTTFALSNYTYGTNTTNITNAQTTANWASNAGLFGSNTSVWSSNNLLKKTGDTMTGILTMNATNFISVSLSNNKGADALVGLAYLAGQYGSDTNSNDLVIRNTPTIGRIFLQNGNAASALCINSNNNIGIGTATPTYKLEVSGTSRFSSLVSAHSMFLNTSTPVNAQGAWFAWNRDGGNGHNWYINNRGGGIGGHIFGNATSADVFTETMRLTYAGLLGLGTTSPTEKLHVESGKIYSDTQLLGTSNDSVTIPSYSFKEDSNTGIFHASNDAIGFTTNGSEKMRINTYGFVGIGTTTPSNLLDVNGTFALGNSGLRVKSFVSNLSINVSGIVKFAFSNIQFGAKMILTTSRPSTGQEFSVYEEYDVAWSGVSTITPRILNVKKNKQYNTSFRVNSRWLFDSTINTLTLEVQRSVVGFSIGVNLLINGLFTTDPIVSNDASAATGTEIVPICLQDENGNISMGSNLYVGSNIVADGNLTMNNRLVVSTLKVNRKTGVDVNVTSTSVRGFSNVSTGIILDVGSIAPASGQSMRVTWSNNTELMRITGAGNVGIGTTNPSYKLDVQGTVGITNTGSKKLQFVNDATTNRHIVLFEGANDEHQFYGFGINNGILRYQIAGPSTSHIFYTAASAAASTELMRIQGNGNVGIGVTPSYKLDVNGVVRVANGILMNQNDDTYIGISATNSAPSLGLIKKLGNLPYFAFTSNYGNSTSPNSMYFGMLSGSNLGGVSACNLTTYMTLDNAGNLGIGTTTPTYKLDVSGYGMRIQGGVGSTPTVLAINPTGSGNTIGAVQFVNSGHAITCTDSNNYNGIGNIGGGHNIYYQSTGHNFAGNIYAANSVGIGTSNPSYKLDVSGTTRITNSVTMGQDLFLMSNNSAWSTIQGRQLHMRYSTNSTNDGAYIQSIDRSTSTYYNMGFEVSNLSINPGNSLSSSTPYFYVKYGGNVGIGTSNPGYKLDVQGIVGITNTGGKKLQFPNDITTNRHIVLYESANDEHQFYGFGINNGILRYQVSATSANHVFIAGTSSSTSTELMRIQGTGNVGIGTSSPGAKLQVAGHTITSNLSLNDTRLTFKQLGDSNHMMYNNIDNKDSEGAWDGMKWNTFAGFWIRGGTANGATPTTIIYGSNNGNVGIGTITPAYKFDVSGDIRASGQIMSTSANSFRMVQGNYGSFFRNDGADLYMMSTASGDQYGNWNSLRPFRFNFTSGTTFIGDSAICAQNNGNVGIGTLTPGTKLDVEGDVNVGKTSANYAITSIGQLSLWANKSGQGNFTNMFYAVGSNNSLGDHIWYTKGNFTSGTERMRITDAGNVGIGTALPGYMLDVNGTSRLQNTINVTYSAFFDATTNRVRNYFTSTSLANTANVYRISVTATSGSFSGSAHYIIPSQYNSTGGAWLACLPISTVGFYSTNLLELQMTANSSGVHAFRVVRKVVFSSSTANVNMNVSFDYNSDTTPALTNNTGDAAYTDGTTYSVYSGTPLTQQGGNVGIGTASPSYKLHVVGDIYASGNVTAYSDMRAKSNLEVITSPIDKISQLTGYTYEMLDNPDLTTKITPRYTGIIAQELEHVLPEAVHKDKEGKYSVAYGNMAGLFVESIKELTNENKELKNKVYTLEERIIKLEQLLLGTS